MSTAIAIDASVMVRFLTGDHKEQSPTAADLFRAAQTGKVTLIIPTATIQETVYVLERLYSLDAVQIAGKLLSVLAIPNVHAPDGQWVSDALQMYRSKDSDFGDALLCAYAQHRACGVATFDKGLLKKFPEVTARTPIDWLAGKNPPPASGRAS